MEQSYELLLTSFLHRYFPFGLRCLSTFKPNIHRRHRRDSTRQLRRVGGLYSALRFVVRTQPYRGLSVWHFTTDIYTNVVVEITLSVMLFFICRAFWLPIKKIFVWIANLFNAIPAVLLNTMCFFVTQFVSPSVFEKFGTKNIEPRTSSFMVT